MAKKLYDAEGKNTVPVTSAYTAWGYGLKSSGAKKAAATLKQHGFIEYTGGGENLKTRLSKAALDIILDKRLDSKERDDLTKEAAIKPPIYSELWRHYRLGDDIHNLPSDLTIETFLLRDKGYSEVAAKSIIKNFKETLSLVNSLDSDNISAEETDSSIDDGGTQEADTPMQSAAIITSNVAPSVTPQHVFGGEEEIIGARLGKGKSFRLLASGDVDASLLDVIINMLSAQKALISGGSISITSGKNEAEK